MSGRLSPYADAPWLHLYSPGLPARLEAGYGDGLSLFRSALARAPDGPAIRYFDGCISYRDLDRLSDALAVGLVDRGFLPGDRIALYMQNVPQYLIGIVGAWKAGGIVVPVSPMNRQREVGLQFADSQPKAVICLDYLYAEVISVLPDSDDLPSIVLTTSPRAFQRRGDERVLPPAVDLTAIGGRFESLEAVMASNDGRKPAVDVALRADDIAFLVYTSGTTGIPKAAMSTHGNISFNAQAITTWYGLSDGNSVLGLAPLFHVTGLVGHIMPAWALAGPLVLCYRFDPAVVLDALLEHRPSFTVAAITAFIALMSHDASSSHHFSSFKALVSGGAPIPPSVIEQFRERTGHYIHNGYGLTETNAGAIAVPMGRAAPVDSVSGALAVGVPTFNLDAWIADDSGHPMPIGETGEIVISGPTIAQGYWNKTDETRAAMRPDGFRTGDVGFMDADGWFYLVDRKKDMINASGYKVWPREVEDVLYSHPAVREAAVVGVADAYRGETVRAVISLKPGATATVEDIAAWCRDQVAAYKCPRQIEILDELPKTPTGKILRRMLRSQT